MNRWPWGNRAAEGGVIIINMLRFAYANAGDDNMLIYVDIFCKLVADVGIVKSVGS